MRRIVIAAVAVIVVGAAFAAWYFRSGTTRPTWTPDRLVAPATLTGALPAPPRAVVIVVEENKSLDKIADEPEHAPYFAELATRGALFTHASGLAHPSQPNYFALFAGVLTTNGDACPATGVAPDAPNLASELLAAHRTFGAYAEDLPAAGSRVCASGEYARKHAPWTHFDNFPATLAVPLSALHGFDRLPQVAFMIPNLLNDMHSASRERGDAWLRAHVGPLLAWAETHDGLIIITWDESSSALTNHIPTLFLGPMVKPGTYAEPIDHYRVLRTVEDLFRLHDHAGHAAEAAPITDIWRTAAR